MRFSIRDWFLVTAIVALAVGWAVDHWRLSKNVDAAEDAKFIADALLNDFGHDSYPRLRELCRKYGVKPKGHVSIHLQDLPDDASPATNPSKP